ncbi:MAG: type I glutamate--ammonia ligase, partial [Bacillota bacterium]|nr:type I glutamate--ammonia ligase [Bacillota bacterium]
EEKNDHNIESLPGTLYEAIMELDNDMIIREALGEHIYDRFRHGRIKEWNDYRIQVHSWEIDHYLARF